MTPQDKMLKLKEMMSLLNEGLTRKEFTDAIAQLIKFVKDIKTSNTEEMAQIKQTIQSLSEALKADSSNDLADIRNQVENAMAGHMKAMEGSMEAMMKDCEDKMMAMDEKMDSVQDGKDADETRIVQDVLTQLPPPPFLEPISVRDKLETLQGNERLDKTAIKGIDELEKKVEAIQIRPTTVGGRALLQLYVDGAKKGAIQYLNLIPGSNISLTYSRANGRNDVTITGSAGGALTILTATGAIDGSNTVYTFASAPQIVVVNGTSYRDGHGVTIVTTTATLDFAPVSGSDVYGI